MLNRIRSLAHDHGKAVLLCTHILPDVQAASDAVVMLAHGRVQIAERLSDLSRPATPSLEVELFGSGSGFVERFRERGIRVAEQANGRVILEGPPDELAGLVFQTARDCGVGIRRIAPSRNSLEEIFLKAVREEPHVV
jgi:ABC-2 type transport system ATP-binding protein